MALNDVAIINISATSTTLTQKGFGTILIASYHTLWTDKLVHSYTDADQWITEGGHTYDPTYKKLAAAFGQKIRPEKVLVGRLTAPYTQVQWLTINGTVAEENKFEFVVYAGTQSVTVSVTADADDAAEDIAGKLVTAIGSGITGLTAAADATKVTLTSVPGKIVYIKYWTSNLRYEDKTPDFGIADQLAAINLENNDWYQLVTDINSKATTIAASDWLETQTKLYAAQTADWQALLNADNTNVMWVLKNQTQGRTYFAPNRTTDTGDMADAAMAARIAVWAPGSYTLMGKDFAGISVDPLTPTQVDFLRAQNGNVYITTSNVNHLLDGRVVGGEWIDVVIFIDWLRIRMQEDFLLLFTTNPKVGFTDVGGVQIEGVIRQRLQLGADAGGIDPKPGWEVTVPKVATIAPADKAARKFRVAKFKASLTGAIHLAEVTGTLVV